jgi:hypothetical protein
MVIRRPGNKEDPVKPTTPDPGSAAGLIALLAFLALPSNPASADPRGVEAIVAALTSPIPSSAADEARAFDARLMSSGEFDGVHVGVVIDKRQDRVRGVAERLLRSAGKDPAAWTVRVLDTEPKLINACVAGGRYVYVFTGLLAQDPGDDELAFILAHGLGHSLLAHEERLGENASATTVVAAGLPALLPAGHEMDPITPEPPAKVSAFSLEDEQEADAMGTCIASRAGFDPLKGANYFTKLGHDYKTRQSERDGRMAAASRQVDQAVANCERGHEQWRNAGRDVPRNELAAMNAGCLDAQQLQVNYNSLARAYNTERSVERRIVLLTAHPQATSRMPAITGVVEVLGGREDVAKLANHESAHNVLIALQQTGSGLVEAKAGAHESP